MYYGNSGYIDALDQYHEPYERQGHNIVHFGTEESFKKEQRDKQLGVNKCKFCTFIDDVGFCKKYNKYASNARESCPSSFCSAKCPTCKKRLEIRSGRYGRFYSCTNPSCSFTISIK